MICRDPIYLAAWDVGNRALMGTNSTFPGGIGERNRSDIFRLSMRGNGAMESW